MVDYSKWDNLVLTSSDDDDNAAVEGKKPAVSQEQDLSAKECEQLEALATELAKENENKIAFFLRHGFKYFLLDDNNSGKLLGGTERLVEVVYKGGEQVSGLIEGFEKSKNDSAFVLIGVRDSTELVNWFSVRLGKYKEDVTEEGRACWKRKCSHWPVTSEPIIPLDEFEQYGDPSLNLFRVIVTPSPTESSNTENEKKKTKRKRKKKKKGPSKTKGKMEMSIPESKISEDRELLKVIIVPGNGCNNVRASNWYGTMECTLQAKKIGVAMQNMPDPLYARENRWIPFIVNKLAGGEENLKRCIVVGHSSGAVAAMRLAERYKVGGIILIGAYASHLNNATEKKSGYFDRAWNWEAQRENTGFIVQFASTDDPFLPIKEQKKVKKGLKDACEYIQLDHKSHFFEMCDELEQCIIERAKNFCLRSDWITSAASDKKEIESCELKTDEVKVATKSRPEVCVPVTGASASNEVHFREPILLQKRGVIQSHNVDVVLQVFSNKIVVSISEDGRSCNSIVRTKTESANEIGTKLWTKTKALMGKSSELIDLLARLVSEHLYKLNGKLPSLLLRTGFHTLDLKVASEVFDLIRSLLKS